MPIRRVSENSPERSGSLHSSLDDIQRSLESRLLVLQPNLDQLERRHHDGFGRTRKTTRCNGEELGVLLLTVVGEKGAPPSVSSDWG